MSLPPKISAAEWQIMELVWASHPASASQVVAALPADLGWSETTVKTLLSRLVKKGALDYAREGRRYLYSPTVSREECVRTEARSFADRVFQGNTSPMLAWFVQQTPLSDVEIAQLQELLDQKKEGQS